MDIKFSVVIPAYNEEKRLPQTLERMLPFLDSLNINYELIIVDDGSRDTTVKKVNYFQSKDKLIKLISYSPNRGRGAAVREGIRAAKGEIILETDSDGSVADEAIKRFLDYFSSHPDVDAIFGSRELIDSKIAHPQPLMRIFLGYCFIYLAKFLFWSWRTSDFTLGFKMFRAKTARDIFNYQFDNQYIAEAEIVYVGELRNWKIVELPVTWTDNQDSRVRPLKDSIRSLKGMASILWRRALRYYK